MDGPKCFVPLNIIKFAESDTDMEVDGAREEDEDDETIEEEKEESKWPQLPDVVLHMIYTYLRDSDRLNMALVCKPWSVPVYSASLWRSRSFRFGSLRSHQNEADRAIGFTKYHAQHLHNLRLTCDHPSYMTCKKFQETFYTITSNLTRTHRTPEGRVRCQLKEFSFPLLQADRYWRYVGPGFVGLRSRLVTTLTRFLCYQRRLESFSMSDALFRVIDGIRTLEAVSKASGRHLKRLNMEDFFHSRIGVFQPRYKVLLSKFRALTSLYTNYNYLNDDILDIMSRSLDHKFNFLSIKACRHDPHFHRIDGMTWKNLRRSCPRLKVHVYLEGLAVHDKVVNLLTANMPLRSLQIWTGVWRPGEEDWHIEDTLIYLAHKFGNVLEEMCLSLENNHETIDQGFVLMLEKCRRLEYLDLQAVLALSTVETLYEMQEQYKIGLERCHMTLENLSGEEMAALKEINMKYEDLVEERGLDFEINANDLPFY